MNSQEKLLKDLEMLEDTQLFANVDQDGVKLNDWAQAHRDELNEWLSRRGALVLRGLKIMASRQFGQLLEILFNGSLLPYSHRSTPRTELRGNVYTATEYHSEQLIQQHNEQAYTNVWPMRIGFFCMLPSDVGGETPIADSRIIYEKIPLSIREEFESKGVLYVRNYSELDLPWNEVFCTENKVEVEQYCNENNIEFEWLSNNGLRTKQLLPATAIHPHTKEKLWFNQAHLFHVSALGADIQRELINSKGKENLPRNTYFGDGTEISDEIVAVISKIYELHKIKFEWNKGDVMLLDNMLFSHGREPFRGERKVLVGMAIPNVASDIPVSSAAHIQSAQTEKETESLLV
jgi:alpha-ketoglutarate-dependent taurine dioxygenase